MKFRFKIDKKVGLNTYFVRYGKGCTCSWLVLQIRVPLDKKPDDYIRGVVQAIENQENL